MSRLINKIELKKSVATGLGLIALCIILNACSKVEPTPEVVISVSTGLRLVHSSAISEGTKFDLYVDDVKVTGSALAYQQNSPYLPITEGNRKIAVKTEAGALVKDTLLNVSASRRYSIFVKEWNKTGSGSPSTPIAVKSLVIADDFNTTAAPTGKIKLRFVNAATTGNSLTAAAVIPGIFQRINPAGSSPATDVFTYNLVNLASDYLTLRTGPVTLSATAPNTADVQVFAASLPTTFESGKLYTLYLTGSPGGISSGGTTISSSLALKVIENNP